MAISPRIATKTRGKSGMNSRKKLYELAERVLPETPPNPGVYLMKDRNGKVFYIGKAKNLKSRLRSYLNPKTTDRRYFVRVLETLLDSVEFSLTANEKEALLLENELIKQYQPRFNVLLRDDKNFLHLRIRNDKAFPRIEVVRRRKKDNHRYFGPYESATSIRNTLRVINRHFQLRTCTDSEFRSRTRPCLEHQIGRCPAPCVLPIEESSYATSIRDATLFLQGHPRPLLRRLNERMTSASKEMAFEQASRYRDQIQAIERSLTPQDILLSNRDDLDVIALITEEERTAFHVTRYREGVPLSSRNHIHHARTTDGDPASALSSFIHQLYEKIQDVPPEIVVNIEPAMHSALSTLLSSRRQRQVEIRVPSRGKKKALIQRAEQNAKQKLQESHDDQQRRMDTLTNLQNLLRLKNFPQRIECFDISNIHGTDAVGSMVVFTEGAPNIASYRKFSIQSVDGIDDFAMMAEMLRRRVRDGEKLGPLPDLIVLDGGRSHLSAVRKAIEEEEGWDQDIVALAKERRDVKISSAPDESHTRKPERVFLPGVKEPILLKNGKATTHLLTWLRDEAHRFAITFHRGKRIKRTLRSQLDDIPGVGTKRRNAMLQVFGSLDGLRNIPALEISERAEIPLAVAQSVQEYLAQDANTDEKSV